MVFNTLTVGAAVTPSVIETYFSHYLNRAPLRQKPTAHISYHEGLRLIRQFLDYSAKHTIEDLQSFTAQWVPAPHWVRINDAEVAPKFLERAARLLNLQLGTRGLEQIGGRTWWQWRRPDQPLRAEWIEMKKEYHERKRTGEKCERVILYVHGGAYYFGSVDEHRYQMQRHARKLKARVLAPRYRLAPQFPFPCGLYDCLAAYFYLLEHFEPSQILFAGDSAGGGMVLAMLVTLRDQEQPLPAGTILLSPWCDLTHSFPSVAGDGVGDYIPPHGFHHRPSMAWPPPPNDGTQKSSAKFEERSDAVELPATAGLDMKVNRRQRSGDGEDDEDEPRPRPPSRKATERLTALPMPKFGHPLSIVLDGQTVNMRDQIQIYTTNELLAHPLVSPVMQPSLGGLPPMLIQVGGAELLRDEQIYIAHKAANPKAYPPNETTMKEFDPSGTTLNKYPPTDVQLQVWDDLCHVPHTLSFTRPAKYMYRSAAQFGAWALAHAQHKGIDIQNDDAISMISSHDGDESVIDDNRSTNGSVRRTKTSKRDEKDDEVGAVGRAGDPLPPFKDHMIRQRVTRHGNVFPLPAESEMACLAVDSASIGVIKQGPVRKWLAIKQSNDAKFANERKKVLKRREKELAAGYDAIPGESPPPTALVNRRRKGVAPEEKKRGKSWGLAMWSGWGSSHDEHTLQREQKSADRKHSLSDANSQKNNGSLLSVPKAEQPKRRRNSSVSMLTAQMPWRDRERPMSPYQQVNDTGQAASSPALSRVMMQGRPSTGSERSAAMTEPAFMGGKEVDRDIDAPIPATPPVPVEGEHGYLPPSSSRLQSGTQAILFRLAQERNRPSVNSREASGDVSGVATPHSELAGDQPQTLEAGSGKRSIQDLREAAAVSTNAKPDGDNELVSPVNDKAEDEVVSPVDDEGETKPEEVVSPLDTEQKQAPSFKLRNTIFDPRVSMLGSIGADGMPNAHHDFPNKASKPSSPPNGVVTGDTESAATPSLLLRADSSETGRSTPFKLRNPVSDARATPTTEHAALTAVTEPLKPSESTKAAPFKLRHTLDPAQIAAPKSQLFADEPAVPSTQPEASISNNNRESVSAYAPEVLRSSGSSSDQPPPAYESMPVTNVTLPERLAGARTVVMEKQRRQNLDEDGPPPTPPPKDDTFAAKAAKKPPMIGNLSFEEGRPGLESFVTASEGNELRGK